MLSEKHGLAFHCVVKTTIANYCTMESVMAPKNQWYLYKTRPASHAVKREIRKFSRGTSATVGLAAIGTGIFFAELRDIAAFVCSRR